MFVQNLSKFVQDFISSHCNQNPELLEIWNSKKNQKQLLKTIKKDRISIKDPHKPKRGKSGYLYFCEYYREKLKAEYPHLKVKQIVSKLGVLWKEMKQNNSEEIRRFEEMSKVDRDRYKQEMTDYNNTVKNNEIDSNEQKEILENNQVKNKKKRSIENHGLDKYIRSKSRKTRKTHPELDSEGVVDYLKKKWEKFPDTRKQKYQNK